MVRTVQMKHVLAHINSSEVVFTKQRLQNRLVSLAGWNHQTQQMYGVLEFVTIVLVAGALNGRNDIVNELMGLNQLPVESWGRCLKNKVVSVAAGLTRV